MNFLFGVMILIAAGAMNGSFALPTKYLKNRPFEHIWLNFSIWTFLIFPCLFQTFLSPMAWKVYLHAPASLLTIILIGGLLFGIGQFCFSLALKKIGMSLSFVINIGISTALGSLIPLVVLHPQHVFTVKGFMTIASVCLIIVGVVLSYFAGSKRDRHPNNIGLNTSTTYVIGVFLAVFAGLTSAVENCVFSLTTSLQQQALHSGITRIIADNIVWPLFLFAAFIPYASYMLYLRYKNTVVVQNVKPIRYFSSIIYMGICYYFSIILYSIASFKIGELGPIIGWPLFMVSIILTANMWGLRHGEWVNASAASKKLRKIGMLMLTVAIVVLGAAAAM